MPKAYGYTDFEQMEGQKEFMERISRWVNEQEVRVINFEKINCERPTRDAPEFYYGLRVWFEYTVEEEEKKVE